MSISGNVIQTWGQSGRNAVYLTNQSGNNAMQVSQVGDGAFQHIGVWSNSVLLAKDEVGTGVNRLRTTASGSVGSASGTQFRLLTDNVIHGPHNSNEIVETALMSGDGLPIGVVGLNTATQIYGNAYNNGMRNRIGSTTDENPTSIAWGTGKIINTGGTEVQAFRLLVQSTSVAWGIKTGGFTTISSSGGGTMLVENNDYGFSNYGIRIKVMSSVDPIWIGSDDTRPDSGIGFPIISGETIDLPIGIPQKVRLFTATSGAKIAYMLFN